jgi:ParB family chromosome partitioning protein
MKKGLGRGLDSMIPVSSSVSEKKEKKQADKQDELKEIEIDVSLIDPNGDQPRKKFDEDELLELSESIKQHGVIEPVILAKRGKRYEMIAGERRWRAAKKAGLKKIPAVIRDYTEKEIMEISLIENIQRQDLNPIEEARAYNTLLKAYNVKQDELAERISKSRTAITNSLRLLKLDERVMKMVEDGMLSEGHARTLLGISDKDIQYETAYKVFDEKLSVRETEKLVKKLAEDKEPDDKKDGMSESEQRAYESYENKIKDYIGSKVSIHAGKNGKGKIEISYYSLEELERISDLILS